MKHVDYLLPLIVCFLTLFGLLMVYDASSFTAFKEFGDKYHFVKDQSIWVMLGCVSLFFFSKFDYHRFYQLSLPLLITSLVLLVLVFIPGVGIGPVLGAHRWINLHAFILQPAEFVKLSLAVYLAAWFSNKDKKKFLSFVLLTGLIVLLVMLEPDMGTAIIILSEALIVYFLSGGNMFYLVTSLPLLGIAGFLLILAEPYRLSRLTAFLNPLQATSSSSYHVKQILIGLGSGGLLGVGIGNSLQKYAYLPENYTDSIFAIIGEELGFIGATVVIVILLVIIWRGLHIAVSAKDKFGRLLAGALIGFLGMQMIINLGAQAALFPLTGVPLPFISYGGSSLVIDLCSIGILFNISKQSHASRHDAFVRRK